jgi:uncharacterized protein YceK
MKKFIVFLGVILLTGCGCILSQIVPQKIYAGSGCTASIPNYLTKVTATDNCEIASFTQTPAPGTLLTATNKTATVTIKATDASGNTKQIIFTVTLLDTIKPVLTIDPSLLTYQTKQIQDIYNFADLLVGQNDDNLMAQPWIDSVPGLREKLRDSSYYKQMLVVTSFQKSDGNRARLITFADSVKLINRTK